MEKESTEISNLDYEEKIKLGIASPQEVINSKILRSWANSVIYDGQKLPIKMIKDKIKTKLDDKTLISNRRHLSFKYGCYSDVLNSIN